MQKTNVLFCFSFPVLLPYLKHSYGGPIAEADYSLIKSMVTSPA